MKTTLISRLLGGAAITALLGFAPSAHAAQQVITPAASSPLTAIYVNDNLGCQFTHTPDTHGEFFSGTDPGSCGTDVAVDGATPNVYGYPDGSPLTPVSQTPVSGTGTPANPYRVTTVADAGTTGIRLTQVDQYVDGQEFYRSTVTIQNTAATAQSGVLYHGADCYLGNDDHGYGYFDAPTHGIYCTKTANNVPADRLVGFVPLTPQASAPSHYFEGGFGANYSRITSGVDLPDTCDCTVLEDNGASLSWSYSLGPAGSATAMKTIDFATGSSPAGIVLDTTPPAVTIDSITSPVDADKPLLTGTAGAAPGDQDSIGLQLYKGSTATGTPIDETSKVPDDTTHKWLYTPSVLTTGTYTLKATQVDDAGNIGTTTRTFTASDEVSVDTDSPDVTLFPLDERITTETPTLSGDAGTALGDEASVRVDIYPGTSAAGTPYRTAPSLTPDSTGHWSYTPVALALGTYTAQATQRDAAGNVGRSTAETFTVVPVAPANLKVTVTQSAPPILVGQDLTFTVTVTNLGPGTATGVNLTDQLPEDATLPDREAGSLIRAGALPKCSRAGRKMSCGVGSLAKGQSASYKFVVVPRKATDIANTASAAGDQVDPVTASNSGQARTTAVRVPKLTKTIDAAVIQGTVRYRKAGGTKFKTLKNQVELPVGSLVDATKGRVRITSSRDAKGHVQSADFYAGEFLLKQRRANHGLTTLLLRGSNFAGCPAASKQANATSLGKKRRRKRRSLWGSGKGSFRTGGRYGSATVRGTIWFTQDNCRSTFFKTARGVVSVRDYVKGKTVAVPKGKTYTARAPR